MAAYLGSGGILVPFKCPSAVGIESVRPAKYRTTIGGLVKSKRSPVSRREWSVDLSTATPAQIANLQSLVEGGKPPWVWVEPYAQVTNMLSPQQSVLAAGTWSGGGVVEGGAVMASDGTFSPRSLIHASGGYVDFGLRDGADDHAAAVPGMPARFSVYVRGVGSVKLAFRDWAGQVLKSAERDYNNTTLARASLASTAPDGAATVRVWVTGALQVALPAVTWTANDRPWAIGHGCNRSSVDGLSEAVQLAVRESPDLNRAGLSFTVREVG